MLRFRLLGVPVGVHVSFLLVAFLAYPALSGSEILAWTIAVFLSVLLHESGHAFTARAFGAPQVSITLFALGGVTTYPVSSRMSAGRRFLISAAGSAVGIAVGGALWFIDRGGLFDTSGNLLQVGVRSFIFASLVWGILNWIPLRPLDGSHMVASFLEIVVPTRAESFSRVISILAGIAATVAAVRYGFYLGALFAIILTVSGLRSEPVGGPRPSAPAPENVTGRHGLGDSGSPDGTDSPPAFPI